MSENNYTALPHAPEAERAILGSIILDNNLVNQAIELLKPDDFYIRAHAMIFRAMTNLSERGSEISPILIGEELKRGGDLEAVGGFAFISDLTYGLPHFSNLAAYAEPVRDASRRRRVARQFAEFSESAMSGDATLESILSAVSADVERERRNDHTPTPQLIQVWGDISAQMLPVGEQIILELERGELGLAAAVTNTGKSTWLRNLSLSVACGRAFPPVVQHGKARRVLLLDFETRLPRFQRDIKRMLGELLPDEQEMVAENFALGCDVTLADEPLNLSDERHLQWVASNARAFAAELIIVDTIAAAFAVREENSNAEVSARILKPLTRMAREAQAAVLFAHHIGKGGSEEGRTSERAYRARGASAFGAFAALVLNLSPTASDSDRVTLSLAKSKGERFDDVNLRLDRETRWFSVAEKLVNTVPTSRDLVLRLFDDCRPRRRHEVEMALSGTVAVRTIAQCLADAVKRGDLMMPKRGIYQRANRIVQFAQPSIADARIAQSEIENVQLA